MSLFKRIFQQEEAPKANPTKPVFVVVVTNETEAAIPYVLLQSGRYDIYPKSFPKLMQPGETLEGESMTVCAKDQNMVLTTSGTYSWEGQQYIFPIESASWAVRSKT